MRFSGSRHTRLISLMLLTLGAGAIAAPGDGPVAEAGGESRFLTGARQLTFEGRRAGEGYFSPDGRRLVFQSEREPGNPFFQIYELDLETGDVRRISNGVGKTTCAFYQAGSGDILFASTHHDPRSLDHQRAELELRASGRQRRYAWDYDPEMEIYVASSEDGELHRLSHARGYDAEGSYSPDGEWIVFSSNRHVYTGELSDEDRKRLEVDPSYFLEIYVMRADGSEPRRVTHEPGYDGGPFFSPDGERMIWRKFDSSGVIADIWSARVDGSDRLQITDFGSMSWAPYPHPSGEYILFTSNKLGFDNFELFIVDTAGRSEPVRVTYTPGFDGLPVPSPDGRRLIWTSNRATENGQLWTAAWNHEAALEALREAGRRGGEASTLSARLRSLGAVPLPGKDGYVVAEGHVAAYLPADERDPAGAAGAGVILVGTELPSGDEGGASVDALLGVAGWLAERRPSRPVAVVAWAGATGGRIDAAPLVAELGLPLEQVAAYVGLVVSDATVETGLALNGAATSSVWPGLIERTNVPIGVEIRVGDAPPAETRAAAFHTAGVPAIELEARPAETERLVRFAALFTHKLSTLKQSPDHRTTERTDPSTGEGRAARPYTGTIPDYVAEAPGLRLEGVAPGGPAERAGLRAGDVIVEFAGRQIRNAMDYSEALEVVEIGVAVEVVILRDGETLTLTIVPGARH